jgi:hypothetical protein
LVVDFLQIGVQVAADRFQEKHVAVLRLSGDGIGGNPVSQHADNDDRNNIDDEIGRYQLVLHAFPMEKPAHQPFDEWHDGSPSG